jgi:hypothetical protein
VTLVLVAPTSQADAALAQLGTLRRDLDAPADIADVMATVTRASALREMVKIATLRGDIAFEAGELHLRALRKLGALLAEIVPGLALLPITTVVTSRAASRFEVCRRARSPSTACRRSCRRERNCSRKFQQPNSKRASRVCAMPAAHLRWSRSFAREPGSYHPNAAG